MKKVLGVLVLSLVLLFVGVVSASAAPKDDTVITYIVKDPGGGVRP